VIPPNPDDFVYAGFWLRAGALVIDVVIMLIGALVFGLALSVFGGMLGWDVDSVISSITQVGRLIDLLIGWIYFAGMESSASGNTFGKRAVGIRVVDLQGQRISFGNATGRYFGKILSALIVLIGYFMAGFTARKQALHDMMAGTLVIKK
jgi:uncharacterized RDD family membrane protein YckC